MAGGDTSAAANNAAENAAAGTQVGVIALATDPLVAGINNGVTYSIVKDSRFALVA